MSTYISHFIKNVISVSSIINCYRKDFAPDFCDIPESHDFWEAVYLDKGSIFVSAGAGKTLLKPGDIYFHKPGESHHIIINGKENVIVYFISFYSKSSAMNLFYDAKLSLTPYLKNLLYIMHEEARKSFVSTRVGTSYGVTAAPDAPIGSAQLYKNYLESFLINLLRFKLESEKATVYSEKEEFHRAIVRKITEVVSQSLYSHFSISTLTKKLNYGRTFLCNVFKAETGYTINGFYNHLKINEAKKLMAEGRHSLAEISEILNFSSRYYFSKVFKKETGYTPSEYKKTLIK